MSPNRQRRVLLGSVKDIVRRRARNHCEKCWVKLAWNPGGKTKGTIHHRHPRRLGGKDTPTNLVVLCHSCHRAVHRDEPAAALEGWLCWVPSDVTPLLLPSGWALLVPDGSTEPLDQEEAELLLAYLHGSYRKVLDKTAC